MPPAPPGQTERMPVSPKRGKPVSVRLQGRTSERSEEVNAALRVFVGQRNASVSTSQLDPDTIRTLAERAVAMAKVAPEDPHVGLPLRRKSLGHPQVELYDAKVPSVDKLTENATTAEAAALGTTGITNSDGGSASHGVTHVMIATTNGFAADYRRSSQGISAVVIAEKDGAMERDYDYTAACSAGSRRAETVGASAAERTLARLGPRKPQTGVSGSPQPCRSLSARCPARSTAPPLPVGQASRTAWANR